MLSCFIDINPGRPMYSKTIVSKCVQNQIRSEQPLETFQTFPALLVGLLTDKYVTQRKKNGQFQEGGKDGKVEIFLEGQKNSRQPKSKQFKIVLTWVA